MATLAGRDLPAKARALGMHVIEWPGWEGRGETDGPFDARGILLHWDAMALGKVNTDLSDNLRVPEMMAQNGNTGAQLWIGRDTANLMSLVFLAAGRKWHAGSGRGFRSIPANRGNDTCVGIETDQTVGLAWDDEMWRYIDLTSILLVDEFGIDPDRWMAGHLEYTPDRKIDPSTFDLNGWRARVKAREPHGGPIGAPTGHTAAWWLRVIAEAARTA